MTKEKTNVVAKKKVYKKPTLVQTVESGKVLQGYCPSSCGQQVANMNSNCGH